MSYFHPPVCMDAWVIINSCPFPAASFSLPSRADTSSRRRRPPRLTTNVCFKPEHSFVPYTTSVSQVTATSLVSVDNSHRQNPERGTNRIHVTHSPIRCVGDSNTCPDGIPVLFALQLLIIKLEHLGNCRRHMWPSQSQAVRRHLRQQGDEKARRACIVLIIF